MERPNAPSRMSAEREQALVARARSDGSAFGELYDFYLPRIYGFILRRVEEPSVAEDLTSATFEKGLQAVRRADFRNEAFGGWLYRVAANVINDHARAGRRLVSLETSPPRGAQSSRVVGDERAAEALAAALDRDHLRRALVRLPAAQRRVLVLRYFDDLSVDELCAVLGCSRGTLAVKIHRALRALRGALAQEAIDAA